MALVDSGRSRSPRSAKLNPSRSRWFALATRVVLAAGALILLASIGRFAAAHAVAVASTVDAGELRSSLPVAEPLDASPPPAPTPPPPPATPTSGTARATPDDPVYLNYASAEQLMRLPGVGAKRAEGIIALRARLGRFQRVEDLLRVKGIGRATIKKLRPLIRLDQPEAGI
jgi:competence protein ComEA